MCAKQMDTTLPFDEMNRQPIQRDAKIAVSVCIYVIRSLDGGVLKNIFRLTEEVAIQGNYPVSNIFVGRQAGASNTAAIGSYCVQAVPNGTDRVLPRVRARGLRARRA